MSRQWETEEATSRACLAQFSRSLHTTLLLHGRSLQLDLRERELVDRKTW